jgi:hypothetical protein
MSVDFPGLGRLANFQDWVLDKIFCALELTGWFVSGFRAAVDVVGSVDIQRWADLDNRSRVVIRSLSESQGSVARNSNSAVPVIAGLSCAGWLMTLDKSVEDLDKYRRFSALDEGPNIVGRRETQVGLCWIQNLSDGWRRMRSVGV